MNKQKSQVREKKQRSRLSRQLLLRYFLSLAVYVAVLALLMLISYQICSMIRWRWDNPIYHILLYVRDYILSVVGIFVAGGWLVITYHFISKPLRYLDELTAASKQMALLTENPIELPVSLKDTENELNLVREKAISDARAAREAEQRKNDLIVYLAHDLKTPLTSVIGYLTLLRDERQISEELQAKYLSISLNKAERLEDLINEFFEITRFNLSGISLEPARINLTRMLEQVIYEFQPMLAEKQLQCILDAPADLTLLCDADKMQRVFDNLLRNAVNYSYEESIIQIQVVPSETELEITVTNHGNTISEEKLKRIFEQFFRLDSARVSKSGGAGLGLAIAKEIVELHHGTITATSEDEKIEFRIRLPRS